MAKQVLVEGATATNKATGEKIVYQGGKWKPYTGAPPAPAKTEAQAKDGFNAGRLQSAGDIIEGLEGDGFDRGLATILPGWVPGLDEKRKYDAAAKEWKDGILRTTSGAQAPESEIKVQDQTYFPQWGDSKAVREQKAAMRENAERLALARAGPGAIAPPPKTNTTSAPPKTAGNALLKAKSNKPLSPAEAASLPAGTPFIGADGKRRTKQ